MTISYNEITLFLLWGYGDSMNFTCTPRLIKNKFKDIKVRVVVKNSHKYLFATNPFVDYIEGVTDDIAIKYRRESKIGNWKNEVNMWVLANNLPKPTANYNTWDMPYESAKQLNDFFKQEIVTCNDNLLPEFFYTDEEKIKAKNFINNNKHFAIIETEFFSSQSDFSTQKIINDIKNIVSKCKFKVFTSGIYNEVKPPFYSLNNYNLREVSLINQGSILFLGLASGISVSSFERTLVQSRKKIIASRNPELITFYKRYKPNNVINIAANEYINIINAELKLANLDLDNGLVKYADI